MEDDKNDMRRKEEIANRIHLPIGSIGLSGR
jgi:hypothetical protein